MSEDLVDDLIAEWQAMKEKHDTGLLKSLEALLGKVTVDLSEGAQIILPGEGENQVFETQFGMVELYYSRHVEEGFVLSKAAMRKQLEPRWYAPRYPWHPIEDDYRP